MKRYIKLVCAILVVLTLCLGLCSCKEMDRLREKRSEWGDELQTVIVFEGKEYKLLSPCRDLIVDPEKGDNYGYVISKEVPLLLTTSGRTMKISRDREMLVAGHWEDGECSKVYARSDLYDSLEAAINSYELDQLCVVYSGWDSESDSVVTHRMLLSEQVLGIINTALTVEGEVMSDYYYGDSVEYYMHFCDETLRFVSEYSSLMVVADDGNKWYLVYSRASDGKTVRVVLSEDDASTIYNELKDFQSVR